MIPNASLTAVSRCLAASADVLHAVPGQELRLLRVKFLAEAMAPLGGVAWMKALPGHVYAAVNAEAITAGAVGAIGIELPGGNARDTLRFTHPRVTRIYIPESGASRLSGVDIALDAARRLGSAKTLGHAAEVCGPGIAAMSLDERALLVQAAVMAGFVLGFVVADQRVLQLVREEAAQRGEREEFETWQGGPVSAYDANVDVAPARLLSQALLQDRSVLHAGELAGTSVTRVVLAGIGARMQGLSRFASLVRGRAKPPHVELLVQPHESRDLDLAREAGVIRDLERLGANIVSPLNALPTNPLPSGCSVTTCPLTWRALRDVQAPSGATSHVRPDAGHESVTEGSNAVPRSVLTSIELAAACTVSGTFRHPSDAFAAVPGDSKVSTRRPAQG